MKLENILNLAKCMVNYVPTHATLSSRTWFLPALGHLSFTRALQIDRKHGRLQRQAQVCSHGCTVSMCIQTSLITLIPLRVECECKESDVDSDA